MSENDLLAKLRFARATSGPHRLRKYESADLDQVRDLHTRSFAKLAAGHHTREQLEAFAASVAAVAYAHELAETELWLLYAGARLCATAGWMPHADAPRTARLRKVFVTPELARRGLATFMVDHVEDRARAAGFRDFFVRANLNAVPLYEKLGYRRAGTGEMPVTSAIALPVVFMARAAAVK